MREVPARYLAPGEIMTGRAAEPAVTTVLGSCVAVVLFAKGKFWSICHGVLPSHAYSVERVDKPGHYVDEAISSMIDRADAWRVPRASLVAKLFGGSRIADAGGYQSVGELNVYAAEDALALAGVEIRAEDVGGIQGRKLVFIPATGDVFVKRLGEAGRTKGPVEIN